TVKPSIAERFAEALLAFSGGAHAGSSHAGEPVFQEASPVLRQALNVGRRLAGQNAALAFRATTARATLADCRSVVHPASARTEHLCVGHRRALAARTRASRGKSAHIHSVARLQLDSFAARERRPNVRQTLGSGIRIEPHRRIGG